MWNLTFLQRLQMVENERTLKFLQLFNSIILLTTFASHTILTTVLRTHDSELAINNKNSNSGHL